MFTGIVETTGTLAVRELNGESGRLEIQTELAGDMQIGQSIAVNGACLTVETILEEQNRLRFHTLAETLHKTNLGSVPVGGPVNLERALALGDRLGGHLVTGHVDGKAKMLETRQTEEDWIIRVELPQELRALAIPKGCIAVDGMSLTIVDLGDDFFTVHIIPHTLEVTNLHAVKPGDWVNLEMDMIGKYILRWRELGEDVPGLGGN